MEQGLMVLISITSLVLPGMYFYFTIAILIIMVSRKNKQEKPNVMNPTYQVYYPYKKSRAVKVMVTIMVATFFCIVIPEILLFAIYAETNEMIWWPAAIALAIGIGITVLVATARFNHKVECLELDSRHLTVKYRKGENEVFPVASYESYSCEGKKRTILLHFLENGSKRYLFLNMFTPNAADVLTRSLVFAKTNGRLPVVEVLPMENAMVGDSPAFVNGDASRRATSAPSSRPAPSSQPASGPTGSAAARPSSAAQNSTAQRRAAQESIAEYQQKMAEIEADPVRYDAYLRSFLSKLSIPQRNRISSLSGQDQKIQAIKECREITGAGLKYAKELVERYLETPGVNYYLRRIFLKDVPVSEIESAMKEYDELYTEEVPLVMDYGEAAGTSWTYITVHGKSGAGATVQWWEYLNILLWMMEKTRVLFAYSEHNSMRDAIVLTPELDNPYGDSCKGIMRGYHCRLHIPEREIEWGEEVEPGFDYIRYIREKYHFDPVEMREISDVAPDPDRMAISEDTMHTPEPLQHMPDTVIPEQKSAPYSATPAGGEWKFVTSGIEGNADVFGVNIFDYEWESTGETAEVTDPSFNQKYHFPIYRVKINGKIREFASGELSPLVYGFFTRENGS
ncbi:MAG: ribosomal protein L7/L12 [Clostridiales bacterium]|nr:ribosomal protein L7/L12 [Clostridiales bacterium]